MDDLVNKIRNRFDHEAAKKILREKYQSKMLFAYHGGMFRASPDMISLLSLYGGQTLVLQDVYDNPVQVNADELRDHMQIRWQEQMNAWLVEWEELQRQR